LPQIEVERVRGQAAYAEDMSHAFTHEPDAQRYAMHLGGQLVCVLDYRVNRNAISLTRTYTQPPHRGNGYAAELVEFAVNDIEATTPHRIVPMCWYVGDWFQAHPERSDLLSR
jgi:predicted GNAT family acetyltransferase